MVIMASITAWTFFGSGSRAAHQLRELPIRIRGKLHDEGSVRVAEKVVVVVEQGASQLVVDPFPKRLVFARSRGDGSLAGDRK